MRFVLDGKKFQFILQEIVKDSRRHWSKVKPAKFFTNEIFTCPENQNNMFFLQALLSQRLRVTIFSIGWHFFFSRNEARSSPLSRFWFPQLLTKLFNFDRLMWDLLAILIAVCYYLAVVICLARLRKSCCGIPTYSVENISPSRILDWICHLRLII